MTIPPKLEATLDGKEQEPEGPGCWQAAEKGLPQARLNTHIYTCIQIQILCITTDMSRHQTCYISLHARTHPNTHTRIHIHTTKRSHPYSYTDTHNQTPSYVLVHY